MKKAVFDFDDTIIYGSIGVKVAHELEKLTNKRRWKDFWASQYLFKEADYEYAVSQLSDKFANALLGIEVTTFDKAMSSVTKKVRLRTGFLQLNDFLVKRGYRTYIISSSPKKAIDFYMAYRNLKFSHIYGLELTEHNDRFLGNHRGAITIRKKEEIFNKINSNNSSTIAITDSPADLVAFKKANIPILVNNKISYYSNRCVVVSSLSELLDQRIGLFS